MIAELPKNIWRYPEPCLRNKCELIATFDDSLATLAQRMLDLMHAERGLGLAGPQVGVCRRIFVCNPTAQPGDDRIYINPELLDLTGAEESEEGCLSIPEVRVHIRRAKRCRIKAFGLTGEPIETEGTDLLARIWQHETDHLDGRLIIDRMDGADQIANKRLIAQLEADYRNRIKR